MLDIMCPRCHRLFSITKEQKEIISNREVQREDTGGDTAYLVGNYRGPSVLGAGVVRPSTLAGSHQSEAVFRLRLKCKHCGHEWTEIKEE